MHRLVSHGLMTVVCAALAAGCSEDSTDRRMTIGNGGSAGDGGSSGAAGSAGASAGSAGTGNGNGGTGNQPVDLPPACSGGCVELNVTIGATGSRQAQFVIRPNPPADMSNNVITWRVRAAEPVGDIPVEQGYINVFAQNNAALNYAGVFGAQIALTPANGFTNADTVVNVLHDVGGGGGPVGGGDAGPADAGGDAAVGSDAGDAGGGAPPPAGGFDSTQVFQYGVQVGALGVAEGTVRIVVEGVDHSDAAIPDIEFQTDVQGLVYDPYMPPAAVTVVHRP